MRYFIDITYKGTNYHGWQIQENAHTVQAEIQNKISMMLKESIEIVGSGRTDAGVHAQQQIAHFDTIKRLNAEDFIYKINSFLPEDISIKHIKNVEVKAHARFDATLRSYEYHITKKKNPFLINQAYYFKKNIDIKKMNLAAEKLLEYQDFQAFSKVKTEVKTFLCTIKKAYWEEKKELIIFHISANRFLRGMVRAIVGTLLEVGLGKKSTDDFVSIIKGKNRSDAGAAAPAHGLYLTKVRYE